MTARHMAPLKAAAVAFTAVFCTGLTLAWFAATFIWFDPFLQNVNVTELRIGLSILFLLSSVVAIGAFMEERQ